MGAPEIKESSYDVAIVGGALAGAASAILLLREQPKLRVLIIEKSLVFGRRVGEATVEVSGYFLSRVLGLTQYLNEAHLVKQGMRFWFYNNQTQSLDECSEVGGRYLSRVPAYQVDRAALDEEVLRRAVGLGASLLRPGSVSRIALVPGGEQVLEVKQGDQLRKISARWVIDASGVAALLARQEGWWRPNTLHPTTAVWARWTGVKDWDGFELAKKYPQWSMACNGIRATATNHFVGPGWWAWCIPLKGGDVSIGVVFDQRLMGWPENGSLGDRLKQFLSRHPVARELMAEAQWREGDVHWRKNLPYYSTTFAGDGFVLVGDAAAFLDPFYSPGMDWISFTTSAAADLILAQQKGAAVAARVNKHNQDFSRSYSEWFQALYQDKYEYMGDFDLMRLAFLLDLGLYYLGVASQPYKRGAKALIEPVFSTPLSVPFFRLIRAYNRRFAQMARSRHRRDQWGKHNHRFRFLFQGYTFATSNAWPLFRAFRGWFWLELTEGWRTWFTRLGPGGIARVPLDRVKATAVSGNAKTSRDIGMQPEQPVLPR
ncbi:MAG TPA: tryptophan 7-halogenase [Candidatus Limnocylindrales bacterium]|jgi:flavin-dependent dehydrogenase|nr:tryptophan 7-halogenase [Candidatus Limnocylindrales bacterium]